MTTEANLLEQLNQIAKHQPVFAGDLICKESKRILVNLGLVMYYEDEDLKIPNYAKGVGGYVLTRTGKESVKKQSILYVQSQ